jgi:murein hydrolase activator
MNKYRNLLRIPVAPLLLITMFAIGVTHSRPGDTQDEISRRQRELESIRREIEGFEEKIKEARQSERESLTLLENLDRQNVLVRNLLRNLRQEEHRLIQEVNTAQQTIRTLEAQIKRLRDHYAGYVVAAYKNGTMRDVELLFGASDVNQLLVRTEYLRKFSDQRRKDLQELDEKQQQLLTQKEKLDAALQSQRSVIREKQQEEKRLADRTAERRNILNTVRKNKTTFERELTRRQQAEQDLRRLIAGLIERERVRRDRDEGRLRDGVPVEILPPATEFVSLQGKLPWPVRDGQISARFGEQVHPVLKTVTQNTGVDITASPGSPVYAVAEGDVVTIWWLPSYGNLIILHHFDGYRTVYANLSEILVAEGDRVLAGDMIARSGESVSGTVIHFEIWKDRDKQNPEVWLQKK